MLEVHFAVAINLLNSNAERIRYWFHVEFVLWKYFVEIDVPNKLKI